MKKYFNADAQENKAGGAKENPEGNDKRVTDLRSEGGPSSLDQAIVDARFGEEAQSKIRDFRVRIDSFYLTAKKLQSSREVALAVTAFQNARQFCGIMLGEKGAKYPYNSMNQPGPVVGERKEKGEELTDVLNIQSVPENSTEEIERLRTFRGKIEDVITDFVLYMENNPYSSIKEFVAQNKVLENLMSGKMWLGEQMAVISGVA